MEKAKYAYKYVWISLGGNDFLKTNCDISLADEVAGNVVNVIKQVVDASLGVANPGEVASGVDIKILYLGYARPSKDVCGGGRTAKLFVKQGDIIFDAIRNSDYAEYVTLVDVNDMFVTAQEGSSETSPQGNSLALSDPAYFEDAIHLNEAGYVRLFSGYRVQSFFGCSVLEMATMAAMKEGLPVGIIAGASIAIVSVLVLAWCCLIKKK
jgi:lysophospholipase L1-like esterase